jgi:ATP-binding cassette subfamily B protein
MSEEIEELEEHSRVRLSTLRRMFPFFKNHRKALWSAVAMVLARTAILVGLPLVFRQMIDTAVPSGRVSVVLMVAGAYLALLVAQGVLEYFQSLVVGFMGISIVNDIKQQLLQHIFTLSIRFFDQNKVGKLISRVESDTQRLFTVFSTVGLQLLWASLMIVISLAVMFAINWRLALYVLAILPVFAVCGFIIFFKMRPLFKKDRELYANITGFLGEHIPAIILLKNLNNLAWSRAKFEKLNQERRWFTIKIESLETVFWFVMLVMPVLAIGAILWQSALWIELGVISIGTVWMFVQYVQAAIHPLFLISEQITELQKALGSAERIFEIFDTEPEVKDPREPLPAKEFTDSLDFKNVTFGYNPEKLVLKDVSFSIKKGTTVAIVGATGAGKTTIISLLARMYDPLKGAVTLDGIDLRKFRQADVWAKIAFVMQDIFLFPGTVLDNLRVLRTDIPDEQVKAAARALGVEEYISHMPDGYQTMLVEQGNNLSFGERQLLSFARALAFNPEILIIDEATSSVDPYTESKIQNSLNELLKGRTAVVIAHRLSTIVKADKILVMEHGQLQEEGTHEELLLKGGIYARLYTLQSSEGVMEG